ncbi:insulinase family protein, partial [bacterium]|nr:insulinase family protein [bacterium]
MIDCIREKLPNGLRLITVHMPSFHSAIALVYMRMGPRFESAETNGLSHVVEHTLFKGTERFPTPEEIAGEIDAIGGDVNGATLPEYTELYVSCHSRHFLRGLGLLAEIVLRPRFGPEHIATEREVILEEMAQYRDAAGGTGSIDELSQQLMWPRQSHAFSSLGMPGNIAAFSATDIQGHYERYRSAENMVLCVAGNFEPEAVRDTIDQTFGTVQPGERA